MDRQRRRYIIEVLFRDEFPDDIQAIRDTLPHDKFEDMDQAALFKVRRGDPTELHENYTEYVEFIKKLRKAKAEDDVEGKFDVECDD